MEFFEIYFDTLFGIMKNLHIDMTPEYLQASTRLSWIVGIIMAGLIIAAVFVSKKNHALGIVTGIFQLLGAVGMQKAVHILLQMDLTHVEYIVGSSQAEVDKLAGEYQRGVLMQSLPMFLGMIAFFVAWVLLLVFIIKCMRFRPKVLAVFALVLQIIRYLAIAPFNTFAAITGPLTEAAQQRQDYLFLGAGLLVVLLTVIPCFIPQKKAEWEA